MKSFLPILYENDINLVSYKMVSSSKVRFVTEVFGALCSQDFTRKTLPEVPIGDVIKSLPWNYYGGTRNALPMNTSGA
ncbi:MAG: hypothetical protein QNJ01_15075 [Desulfobacterales bacterium]|nr:hypothetical protein [Desulfobacterales bacterium]